MQVTENVLYLAFTIFGVLLLLIFCYLVGFDLVVDLYTHIQTFINAHLAVYLNWWRDSTTKGTKRNTSPNVICLQYSSQKWKLF